MKLGKVSETVLKRSILKEIKYTRPEIIHGPSLCHDCSSIKVNDGEMLVMSTKANLHAREDIELISISSVLNSLLASGAEPVGIMLTMLLPETVLESELKQMMRNFNEQAQKNNVQLIGGHTEFTDAVNRVIINMTGVGKVSEEKYLSIANCRPGQDIVMSKSIAIEGTYLLALANKEVLSTRFNQSFIRKVIDFRNNLSIINEAAVAIKHGVTAMHDLTTGGIFGALWEIGTGAKVGLEADLKSINVEQETIEICEYLNLNPYQLISGGSLLMVTDDGKGLVKKLNQNNISASVIGKITKGNDRVLVNDDEIRFLEPPNKDEILKAY